jgi:hypothetical protein
LGKVRELFGLAFSMGRRGFGMGSDAVVTEARVSWNRSAR